MKRLLLLLCFAPAFLFAQSKKKKLLAEQQANTTLTNNLKNHIQYLADDKLEGRRAGTRGEEMAMHYIENYYREAGLEPGGTNGFVQAFTIDEGRQINEATHLVINGKKAVLYKEFFPVNCSALKAVKGAAALGLNEGGSPWSKDIKDWLEDTLSTVVKIEEAIQKYAAKASGKGATALLLYNSSQLTDKLCFEKSSKTTAATIPVIYITKEGVEHFFKDASATQEIDMNVSISDKIRTAHNVIGYVNNNAANTVILAAHYDHLGFGEDKNANDTLTAVHNGADDNASGTAALLELAKMLKQSTAKNNNYLFVNLSAEELKNAGSTYWLKHLSPNISMNYLLDIDMIGRYDTASKLTVGAYTSCNAWSNIFETTTNKNLLLKFDKTLTSPGHKTDILAKTDMPLLYFFTGTHADFHKASDSCDKINYDGERQVVQYIYNLIQTADSKGKLVAAR